jgi:ABC-2 type transport system ATP-binding protein
MNDVIETHELSKQFRNVIALDRVSLCIPEGSIYGILGPNGAGKSTLMDILVNLQQPTSGSGTVLGVDSRDLRDRHFASVGYVAEHQEFPDWMTIRFLLGYLKPFYPNWDDARANELLHQFGLPPERKLKNLSRGMRMKTYLTASMAYRPNLLILDEPLSGLDPLTRDELIEALVESATETTVVVSSHDLTELETFASHVGYLSEGQLRFSEELTDLTARFREISVTLDQPGEPDPWPSNWICQETGTGSVRFIETRFDPDRTDGEIRLLFNGIRHVETTAMPLRSIFIALARSEKRVSGAAR